jgi:putative phage-type endonuclease
LTPIRDAGNVALAAMPDAPTPPTRICPSTDRARWLAQRKLGIGASDAPAILGLSRFSSPHSIAATKLGLEVEDAESELMRWGRYVESPMLEAFAEETGFEVSPDGWLYRSAEPGLEWLLATPDGQVRRDGVVGGAECKLKVFGAREWEESGVPDEVVCQAQHTMRVMGWGFVFVIALLDGYRLRHREIVRDDAMIARILEEERAFLECLRTGKGLPVRGPSAANARALRALHPADSGAIMDLAGPEWLEKVDAWRDAAEQESAWKKRKEALRDELAFAMGDATFARLEGGRTLSLKTTDRDGYQVKATRFRTLREVQLR